ncbi:MAG: Cellulase (glycosyl hydrolase family 5) [Lentisphaerae bacterium ADurb.BinA184]|nr:MAG: Cellulase (glycosyl hydrolase family 5) [Lentisphaerae bacterium ADurb.BinA184]
MKTMPSDTVLSLNGRGYFVRGGVRVVPVGVNYWPGSCGVEMWAAWPESEIRHDLDVVRDLGLNCVRFFLRWQDFEPRAGHYDVTALGRLDQLLGWFRERELLAQPSLIVGGMSGGRFWPDWKSGRNLYTDDFMLERSADFARQIAGRLTFHQRCLAGIDYGNELDGVDRAEPAAVRRWCQSVSQAVRSACPQALLVSGVSGGPLTTDGGWRYTDDLGTDFHSFHNYPVPHWTGLRFDGIRDRFAQALLPHGVSAIRVHGPVMVQEFGTLVTAGAASQEAYLRAVLPAAWEAGANGFLWWCLRDIRSRAYNYLRAGMESTLGLVDDQDRVKPGLQPFIAFARDVQSWPAPERRPATCLYWPRHYYSRETPANVGNDPRSVHNRMLSAYHQLSLNGTACGHVRGGQPFPEHVRTIVIAGCHLDADEAAALAKWVEAGGRLLWHAPFWHEWGPDLARLLGARPADFRLQRRCRVTAFGATWPFEWWHTPEECRLELHPEGAVPIGADETGFPFVWRHDLGAGRVLFCLASVEEAILNALPDLVARDRWAGWYAGALKELT